LDAKFKSVLEALEISDSALCIYSQMNNDEVIFLVLKILFQSFALIFQKLKMLGVAWSKPEKMISILNLHRVNF